MISEKLQAEIKQNRTEWLLNDNKRDAGLSRESPNVRRMDNIKYNNSKTSNQATNLLDVYLPKYVKNKVKHNFPVIVNIHGGNWFYGSKETNQFYGLMLAEHGFGVVNFNYRLAPQNIYPAALQDVNQVMMWLVKNAAKYQLDLNNVFIVGDSVGAQLAEQYTTAYSNEKYRRLLGLKKPSLVIRAIALNCGLYFLDQPGVIKDTLTAYLPREVFIAHQKELATEKYITKSFPPTYIMTANQDYLRDGSLQLARYLSKKGIFHVYRMFGDKQNPRGHVFQINQRDKIAKVGNIAEINFFEHYIKD